MAQALLDLINNLEVEMTQAIEQAKTEDLSQLDKNFLIERAETEEAKTKFLLKNADDKKKK